MAGRYSPPGVAADLPSHSLIRRPSVLSPRKRCAYCPGRDAVLKTLMRRRLGEAHERGFTLIERSEERRVGKVCRSRGWPLYLGKKQDAKLAEGKEVVGTVWASMQSLG